ncbi:MAG: rRNA maturation RNase YbeY [Planctomycetes bacterium]|nr:rRNA maturation RNase YbeY [Planctomycetota bacterium]NUQ35192.1 rRNA maturation RNase YbeY [Planctomycetaceae bacterium]
MPHQVIVTSTLRGRVPSKLLRNACLATLKHERAPSAQIEVLVTGASRMRAINKKHLKHDYVTDVLSFNLGSTPGTALLGQIVICKVFAEKEARARNISTAKELARYVIHGTLHLLGYDDHSERARAKMWKTQERIVKMVVR